MSLFTYESLSPLYPELNDDQKKALPALFSERQNVFLSGGAGTGKSFLLRKYIAKIPSHKVPVLASTGAAAVLLSGRTFHSFFGLGIMEGGPKATLERASKDKRLHRRLRKIDAFVVDEVSMLPGQVLTVAEQIARLARSSDEAWGGLKVIAVGDFSQLPPVTKMAEKKLPRPDWAFLDPVWEKSNFFSVQLKEMMRSHDEPFNQVLAQVRVGNVSQNVKDLLDWRSADKGDIDPDASQLYARRVDVDRINLERLRRLEGPSHFFPSEFGGDEKFHHSMESHSPIPKMLELRKNALVMLRQNDPQGRWVNGSLGHALSFEDDIVEVRLLTGRTVEIEPAKFVMQDAEGNEIAYCRNFPLTLAYAITIHKAQGATLDRAVVTVKNLWEPGQAYVALSRLRSSEGLWVDGWEARSIFADPLVKKFHESFGTPKAEFLSEVVAD